MPNDGFSIGTGEGMVCGEGGATDALSRQVRRCPIVLETECNFLRRAILCLLVVCVTACKDDLMACCFCLMSPRSPFCRIAIAVRGM